MKKILILSISILLFSSAAFTQVQLTQYFQDGTYYNPAAAGTQEAICASMYGRQQWMGFSDEEGNQIAPMSVVFNVHAPVYALNSGIGLNVVYDKSGFEQNMGVKLNYAYIKTLQDERKSISVGIGVSMLSKTIDYENYILEQPSDPLLQSKQSESGKITDMDFGIQYQDRRKFYAGISGVNLLGSSAEIGNVSYSQDRNVYITGGYYIKVIEKRKQSLYVVPSLLIKSNLVNMQIDISARAEYNNLMAGLSYRYQDAVAVLAGVNLNGFRFGASYDLTTGSLSNASNGSVEIFIGYCHTIRPKVKLNSLYNTRYL
jgi:type IX secretion system PorP/SprF family membrane protein